MVYSKLHLQKDHDDLNKYPPPDSRRRTERKMALSGRPRMQAASLAKMVRAAMLLLHLHLPKIFAFKYEFAKDPVPLQSSYWMLGQITVAAPSRPSSAASSAATSSNGGSPEVSIDLKTSVDNAAAIESITSKLGNVQVGFAPDYVFAKMDEKSRFCCTEADQCEGGAGTFSVTSKRRELELELDDEKETKRVDLELDDDVGEVAQVKRLW